MTAFFISADWSKDTRKRSVYVAHLEERRIRKAHPGSAGWNLGSLLSLAREYAQQGGVLLGVDLALGVSRGYWRLFLDQRSRQQPETFVHWLRELDPSGEFFETTRDPRQWGVDRPWFRVREGEGGLRCFTEKVDDRFLRPIDRATQAKPLFAVSGIPGTVGSATRDFWKELIPRLVRERDFAIWPFEESLSPPRSEQRIVLAESYPALAYAAALAENLPTSRMTLGKTNPAERNCACDLLAQAEWIVGNRVDLGELGPVRASDDDFDAHITAAAVLRCTLEGVPLADESWIDARVEGSMLLAGPVDPEAKVKKLNSGVQETPPSSSDLLQSAGFRSCRSAAARSGAVGFRCPIPGCEKVFTGTRSGWDAHVGSLRKHPDWHPEVRDSDERKRLFERDYPSWLSSTSKRSARRKRAEGDGASESTGGG